MGRSYTPTYRVEYRSNSSPRSDALAMTHHRTMAWHKRNGRPTEANLEKWRKDYNESFQPGGVNGHISESQGFVEHISSAHIIRQATGECVAKVIMPMFEVA